MNKKKCLIVLLVCAFLFSGCGEGKQNGIMHAVSEKMDAIILTQKRMLKKPRITDEAREEIDEKCQNLFYYRQLEPNEKEVYQEVYDCIVAGEEAVVSMMDVKRLEDIYTMVLSDHPEFFYLESIGTMQMRFDETPIKLLAVPKNRYTQQERLVKQQAIDAYTSECLLNMDGNMGEYEKVKYIYDYIIDNTEYDLSAENNQNILSVMEGQASVCKGYAEATQYLLQKCGIEATTICGEADNESHAWNLVKIDGQYYYLDTTWGEVDYLEKVEGMPQIIRDGNINYDYFLITTQQIEKNHSAMEIEGIVYPVCDAIEANYYVREGLMFDDFSPERDLTRLKALFDGIYAQGKTILTLKCKNEDVLMQMKEYLFDEQAVFQFVDTDSISYTIEKEVDTLTIFLEDGVAQE